MTTENKTRQILRTLGQHLIDNTEPDKECEVRLLAKACVQQGRLALAEMGEIAAAEAPERVG